jgi:hypothetical protein
VPQLAASMEGIGIAIVLVLCALIMVFPFVIMGSLLARDIRAERALRRAARQVRTEELP